MESAPFQHGTDSRTSAAKLKVVPMSSTHRAHSERILLKANLPIQQSQSKLIKANKQYTTVTIFKNNGRVDLLGPCPVS